MKHYEVTFIVDPVLSGDEIKATAQNYVDQFKSEGCTIVHNDEMGLRQLAYPINRRTSGVYYSVEVAAETGEFINKVELAFRRDERIMRFLTIGLDKYGIKYNDDKRNGLIGTFKKKGKKGDDKKEDKRGNNKSRDDRKAAPKKEAPKATPAKAAPVAAAAEAKAEEE